LYAKKKNIKFNLTHYKPDTEGQQLQVT